MYFFALIIIFLLFVIIIDDLVNLIEVDQCLFSIYRERARGVYQ